MGLRAGIKVIINSRGANEMTIGTTQGKPWTETLPTSRGARFDGRTFFRLHMAGDALPSIAEIWATADHAVDGHSHDAHELLYVLRGVIEVNGQTVQENEVAFIPRGTRYSARVLSDDGSHVLRVEFPHDATGNEPPEYDAKPWSGPLSDQGFPDLNRE
jgi:redox-sensitive bicupin YhaK (pirin superfamily)